MKACLCCYLRNAAAHRSGATNTYGVNHGVKLMIVLVFDFFWLREEMGKGVKQSYFSVISIELSDLYIKSINPVVSTLFVSANI